MTTTFDAPDPELVARYESVFRALPDFYLFGVITCVLSVRIHDIARAHQNCTTPGCDTCTELRPALAILAALENLKATPTAGDRP